MALSRACSKTLFGEHTKLGNSLIAQTPYTKTSSEIPESTRTRWHEWFSLRFHPSNISL
jgi:hypothetical protein